MNRFIQYAGAGILTLGLVLGMHTPAAAQSMYAQCQEYINVRSTSSIDSEVVGKIYNGNIAQVLCIPYNSEWMEIHSGNVTGWVKQEFFNSEPTNSYVTAQIYAQKLNVRTAPDENADVFGAVYEGQQIEVVNYEGDWVTLAFEDGAYGFANANYVGLNTYYGVAETLEEEQIRQEEEYIEYVAQQNDEVNFVDNGVQEDPNNFDYYYQETDNSAWEQIEEYRYADNYYQTYQQTTNYQYTDYDAGADEEYYQPSTCAAEEQIPSNPSPASSTGQAIVDYAKQFVGNPYVYGGTSLTNGTDCSGFTQSVMANFGVAIPRTAAAQSGSGTSVSLDNIQAGDLLFYDNGEGIGHVAIYNGDGTVTHASNPNSGITVSSYDYRTPVSATRYY